MKELDEIIKDYLKQEATDFAIMIDGDWGCGKTYYLEHEFKKLVQSISSRQKPEVQHKVVQFLGKSKN